MSIVHASGNGTNGAAQNGRPHVAELPASRLSQFQSELQGLNGQASQSCLPPAETVSRTEVLRLYRQALERLFPARHSPDFASVVWFGTYYTFSAGQSAILKILWAAWENGTPDVRQETLLMESGSESKRLESLFKNHPAWQTMICSSPAVKGGYRLAEPAAS